MYKHVEAYCLMQYQCKSCGQRETIWNSRDGATPGTTTCRFCEGETHHVDYHLDRCVPDYVLAPGDRIFRDMTDEDKLEIAKNRLESFKGTKYYPQSDEQYEEVLKGIIAGFREGAPISEIVK